MKFKRHVKKQYKAHEGDVYKFVNGIAMVPGFIFGGNIVLITIKEFNLLTSGVLNETIQL